jgi:peptide/nickel transport system substrate-binding protein
MDRETRRRIEEFRRTQAGPIENNLIDEWSAGELDRSEFLRRGAMFGLSVGVLGSLAGYAGLRPAHAAVLETDQRTATKVLRVAMIKPTKAPEPYQLADEGGLGVTSIVGEFLTFSDAQLRLRPWLATSWKPNKDATVWTFQIRRGVRFHSGQTMTADDVVATFKVLAGKDSQASSALGGILAPAGVVKRGPYTVEFHLQQPTGGFPYLVSQTTYQASILPKNYKKGTYVQSKMPGTGPYKFKSYTEGRGAEFVRNNAYWGGRPALDGVKLSFYEGTAPQVLALRAGQVDLVQQLSAQEAKTFAGNKKYQVWDTKTSNHRQFGFRVDQEPFKDARVRRAVALTLNRPGLVSTLFGGHAVVGNDSPFWTGFPSHAPSVKQRTQNIQLAKALLSAAGKENLKFAVTTYRTQEIPDYAQIIQSSAKDAGIDVGLEFLSSGDYYGAPPGTDYNTNTPWLNRVSVITDYGHRAIPNVFLTAPLVSGGPWNQSHYANPVYDSAVKSYIGAADLQTQRKYAKQIEGILLRDTPVVFSYFYNYVAAGTAKVKGYQPEGLGGIELRGVSLA